MQNEKNKYLIYNIAVIGMMAAMVFVATNLRIPIPTALGKTMIHFGNVFCLLAGLTLGGLRGGLAAGIGSMFFDLVDPAFISSAPWTLVFKFIMGYLCGKLSTTKDNTPAPLGKMFPAAVVGAITYVILYIGKSVITDYFLLRNPWETVFAASLQKGIVSTFNAIVAVVVSVSLAPVFRKAMQTSGIYSKLYPSQK